MKEYLIKTENDQHIQPLKFGERSLNVHTIHIIRAVENRQLYRRLQRLCVVLLAAGIRESSGSLLGRGTLGACSWLFRSRGWDRRYKAKKNNKKRKRKEGNGVKQDKPCACDTWDFPKGFPLKNKLKRKDPPNFYLINLGGCCSQINPHAVAVDFVGDRLLPFWEVIMTEGLVSDTGLSFQKLKSTDTCKKIRTTWVSNAVSWYRVPYTYTYTSPRKSATFVCLIFSLAYCIQCRIFFIFRYQSLCHVN